MLTSPGHPSTNGQAENFVKTIKKSLYAILKDNREEFNIILNRFLMDYRNTTHCSTKETPAKLFLGRSVRTRFDMIKPPILKEEFVNSQEKSIQNHKGKRFLEFKSGQNIYIRDYTNPNKPKWAQATVKEKVGTLSYNCILTNNRVIRRHLDQIRPRLGDKVEQIVDSTRMQGESDVACEEGINPSNDELMSSSNEDSPATSSEINYENNECRNNENISSENDCNEQLEIVNTRRNLRPRKDGKAVK